MAAGVGGETVKAPGSVVMSGYVTVPDVTKTVTPDLKLPGTGRAKQTLPATSSARM